MTEFPFLSGVDGPADLRRLPVEALRPPEDEVRAALTESFPPRAAAPVPISALRS